MVSSSPKRIMIFGIPGNGKSTFAAQLGELLHIPVEHLDRYFYIENWVERDYNQFLQIQKGLVEKDKWIIDGNAIKSLEIRFKRSDMVLYFRFNRLLCLWRIFKRLLFKDHRISDRAEGCSENVCWQLIRYLWNFNERVKASIQALKMEYPHVQFYELRNQQDVRNFIQSLKRWLPNMNLETCVYEKKPEGFCPDVEIAAIYVNVEGKLLLLRLGTSKRESGAWGVPAGKLEAGETPVQGARRELFEETGIDIESEASFQCLGELYIRKPDMEYVYHLFCINLKTLPSIHLSWEHSSYRWVSRQEAENLP